MTFQTIFMFAKWQFVLQKLKKNLWEASRISEKLEFGTTNKMEGWQWHSLITKQMGKLHIILLLSNRIPLIFVIIWDKKKKKKNRRPGDAIENSSVVERQKRRKLARIYNYNWALNSIKYRQTYIVCRTTPLQCGIYPTAIHVRAKWNTAIRAINLTLHHWCYIIKIKI